MEGTRRTLALDLGTTAVKVAVVEHRADGRPEMLAKATVDTRAYVGAHGAGHPHGHAEQSVRAILAAINEGVGFLDARLLETCTGLAVTDQMHGVVLWNSRSPARCSHLITWQDARADAALLGAFNGLLAERASKASSSGSVAGFAATAPVFPGFGWVTLAALLQARHPWVTGEHAFDCAGTLGAYITNVLAGGGCSGGCGECAPATAAAAATGGHAPLPLPRPVRHHVVMDPTDAASWGAYDARAGGFDADLLAAVHTDLPRYLPRVVPSGSALGRLAPEGVRALGLITLSPMVPGWAEHPPVAATEAALPAAGGGTSRSHSPAAAGSSSRGTSPALHGAAPGGGAAAAGAGRSPPLSFTQHLSAAGSGGQHTPGAAALPPLALGQAASAGAAPPAASHTPQRGPAADDAAGHHGHTHGAAAGAAPYVYVSVGDHAAATTAALAYAVRLQQAQMSSQVSFRHRLRAGSGGSASLTSEGTARSGTAGGAAAGGGGGSSSVAGSELGDDDAAPPSDTDADECGSSCCGPVASLPGLGRLTVVVVNIGTSAQVAAAGAAVTALVEGGADGRGSGGLPQLPLGCELRPLPSVRLDGGGVPSAAALAAAASATTAPAGGRRVAGLVGVREDAGSESDAGRDTPAGSPLSDAEGGPSPVPAAVVPAPAARAGAIASLLLPSPSRQSSYASAASGSSSIGGGVGGGAILAAPPSGVPTPLMLVAASMNGGSVLACIADRLTRWGASLAEMQARAARGSGGSTASPMLGPADRQPWAAKATYFWLESEAAKVFLDPGRADSGNGSGDPLPSSAGCVAGLTVLPTLAAERVPVGYQQLAEGPAARSAVTAAAPGLVLSGLTGGNSDSPGALYASAAQAVVRNVCGMLPAAVWAAADVVVATGGGLYKSAVLRRCLSDHVSQIGGRAEPLQVVRLDEARAEYAGCIGAAITADAATNAWVAGGAAGCCCCGAVAPGGGGVVTGPVRVPTPPRRAGDTAAQE